MDQKYYNISYAESPFGTLNQYMTRTYGWMAAGLLVTFATALLTVTTPLFELMVQHRPGIPPEHCGAGAGCGSVR